MDTPAWIQAGSAVVALFLTYIISRQTVKIRELSDVTDALIKQTKIFVNQLQEMKLSNEILQKRLNLELAASFLVRVPFFKRANDRLQDDRSRGIIVFHLWNHGTRALNIKSFTNQENIYSLELTGTLVNHGDQLQITLRFSQPDQMYKVPFSFSIISMNSDNLTVIQNVQQKNHDTGEISYLVAPPELWNE